MRSDLWKLKVIKSTIKNSYVTKVDKEEEEIQPIKSPKLMQQLPTQEKKLQS